MIVEGVDYSTERPSIAGLQAVGKVFACRYGGPGTFPKWLDPEEAKELARHGLAIVANAEGAEAGLLGGHDVGVDWATKAEAHFHRCGMPPTRPIYLSVDFDMQADQWPAVRAALAGAASVLGPNRVGVYGGRRVIARAQFDDAAQWFWQTHAWSGDFWVPGVHIEQYRNKVSLVGGTVDLDRGMTVDFGQWAPVGFPQPIPGVPVAEWTAEQITHETWRTRGVLVGTDPVDLHTSGDAPEANILHRRIKAIADDLTALATREARDDTAVLAKLDELAGKVDTLAATPLIDATAVAQAIATNPDIVGALATGVARQLGNIVGEITLSGGLSASIRPPAV